MESVYCSLLSPPLTLKLSSFSPLKHCSMAITSSMSSPSKTPTSRRKDSSKPIETPVSLTRTSTSTTTTTATTTTTTTTTIDTRTHVSVPPKKVLVPIGFGTEEMEAVIIVHVLRRAGAEVIVASVEPQLEIEAAGGTRLVADTNISTCSNEVFDLVALPGGMPGSARLRDCEILRQITRKHAEDKKLYGAICAAPAVTLLPWGLLRKKQITCHPAFMDKLPTFWAVKSNIQVSGGVTTSRGPGTSFEFALSLADQLFGESVAKDVAELLLMNTADDTQRKEEFNKVEWSVNHRPCVLVPVANGSEEIEVVPMVDILRRAKVDVVVASIEKSVQILGSQGTKIIADKLIGDAAKSIYDLIVLPGEIAGSERLHKCKVLKNLLLDQDTSGRIYGAVCSSTAVLHRHGLLKDKRTTAHPSVASKLTNQVINHAKVVIDGKLITSKGLATITEFALAIVSKLYGHARARSVAEGLVFDYPIS